MKYLIRALLKRFKWHLLPQIRANTGMAPIEDCDMNQLISLLAAKYRDSSRSVKRDEPSDQHLIKPAEVETGV